MGQGLWDEFSQRCFTTSRCFLVELSILSSGVFVPAPVGTTRNCTAPHRPIPSATHPCSSDRYMQILPLRHVAFRTKTPSTRHPRLRKRSTRTSLHIFSSSRRRFRRRAQLTAQVSNIAAGRQQPLFQARDFGLERLLLLRPSLPLHVRVVLERRVRLAEVAYLVLELLHVPLLPLARRRCALPVAFRPAISMQSDNAFRRFEEHKRSDAQSS